MPQKTTICFVISKPTTENDNDINQYKLIQ